MSRGAGYSRMRRVNELLRQVLGDELERLDDERLGVMSITGVECEPDLRRATVYFDTVAGGDGDEQVTEVLEEHRAGLQAVINAETHLKRTPVLSFRPDPATRQAARIEKVLAELRNDPDGPSLGGSPVSGGDRPSGEAQSTRDDDPPSPR